MCRDLKRFFLTSSKKKFTVTVKTGNCHPTTSHVSQGVTLKQFHGSFTEKFSQELKHPLISIDTMVEFVLLEQI